MFRVGYLWFSLYVVMWFPKIEGGGRSKVGLGFGVRGLQEMLNLSFFGVLSKTSLVYSGRDYGGPCTPKPSTLKPNAFRQPSY